MSLIRSRLTCFLLSQCRLDDLAYGELGRIFVSRRDGVVGIRMEAGAVVANDPARVFFLSAALAMLACECLVSPCLI